MSDKKVCSNPSCQKMYSIDLNSVDDGFCSFECWEAVKCNEIPKTINNEATIKDLMSYKICD